MKARSLASWVVLVLGLFGCTVQNRSSIELTELCMFPDTCVFSGGTCGQVLLHKPWVDVSVTDQFVLYVQANNQLPNNENIDIGQVNTNDANVEEYEVTYSGAPVSIPASRLQANGQVPAGGSTVLKVWPVIPGSGAAGLLDQAAAAAGGFVDVVAHLVARGKYVNGSTFETGEFDIAFTACDGCFAIAGCLLACPPPVNQYGTLAQYGACVTP